MLNKYKIISLIVLLFLVIPLMAQTSRKSSSREREERSREQGDRRPTTKKSTAKRPTSRASTSKKSTSKKPTSKREEDTKKSTSKRTTSKSQPLKRPVTQKKPISNGTVKKETFKLAITEKKEKIYLPKAGDYSIGISANPLLDFVGNMFNGTIGQNIGQVGGGILNPSLISPNTSLPAVSIMGKYMKSDKFAVRANVGFILGMQREGTYVQDDAASLTDPLAAQVIDYKETMSRGGSISLGIERRVGDNRVQGVFSASALYSFVYTESKYLYGNAVTEINQKPSIGVGIIPDYTPQLSIPHARELERIGDGPTSTAGLVFGLGVEWFIAPMVSIGAEINLVALYTWSPEVSTKYEGYNPKTNKVDTYIKRTAPKSLEIKIGTQNIGANIAVNFYF